MFFILIFFSAPRAARLYINKNSDKLIGRKLEIEKIRFNYITGTLRINNLRLFEADGKTVFLSFKRLKVNLDYLPLLRDEIYVKYLLLDDPYAEVLQNGDIFNFSDLLKSDSSVAVRDTVPAKPLKYNINDININRGFVKYTDQSINHTVSLNRVDLKIPGFTWNSDSTNLGIDFRFVDGGRLFSNLSLNQADSTYSVRLKLDSLNLNIVEPYVQNTIYISGLNGYLSNDIMIKGDMRSIMRLSVHGMNHIFNFQLLDTLKRTIFSFDDLTVDIDTLQPDRDRIELKSVDLKNPFILFELRDSTNNWLSIMKPAVVVQADTLHQQPVEQAAGGNSFAFSKLTVSDGSMKISDRRIGYPFNYNIENITINGSSVAKMPGTIDVSMSGGLNGTGNFKVAAVFNPADVSAMDVSMAVKEFRMQDMDPYFKHYFGFPVTGGRMNFSTENKLRNQSLASNNSLYFRKFTLGKKGGEKALYNIPLRLALGVMSDKDGIIDLKAPVEMKGENVKVGNLRKIIFHTIGTLFVKAAVSPVNMLAGIFKVDPETLKEIELPLTDVSPDVKNMKSVDLISEILASKPGLSVDFVYCFDPEKTSDTLARIMAVEDFLHNNSRSGSGLNSVPDSILSAYILARVPSDSLLTKSGLNVLCRNYIGAENLKTKIDSMKISQTNFLRNYMIRDKQIPADRCQITLTTPDSIKYEKANPSFRAFFNAAGD